MEFLLLGPLVVRRDGVAVPVSAGKKRAVLAALLLNAGRAVPVDELAETLWGTDPPPSARVTVRNYVRRLRHDLGEAGQDRISTQPGGYLINADADELDVARFEALLRAARAAAKDGRWDQVAAHASAALLLWRGEPLADVDSAVLAVRAAARLAESRLQALELRIEADLQLSDHASVIAELRQLTVAHPLREQLHGQLMLALYRCGRQAEALAAYQAARRILIDELGTEPGTGLRELHQRILSADPLLAVAGPRPGPAAAGPDPARPAPRQLPAPVRHFTGRKSELDALTGLLAEPDGGGQTMVISAIGGTAGVGKTALALHWAHLAADHFPDGQLYTNLRGYDPGQPVPPADALAVFLSALGVPGQDIPAELDERAARYRGLLAGRRVLVVLDNAGEAEQVRPLLPGTPTCLVVVTSRDSLAGLVARDGAQRLDLGLLLPQETASLLRALIGDRADADPAATKSLAEQCCRLPLALRVAAELAVSRPGVPLAGLATELADRRRRLDLLAAGGDPRTAVRAVFSWSYQHLEPPAARAFRLLSLHPGADFDAYATAALIDRTLEESGRAVGALARAYLIQPAGPGRYGLHDLLSAYGRELAAADDGEDGQRAALTRLLDHYLYAAATAMDTLHPAERHRRPRVTQPATPVPGLADPAVAKAWLDQERASLISTATHAAGHGWPGHAIRIAATVSRYLVTGGHYPEARVIHAVAHQAAHRAGDLSAEATALTNLGVAEWEQGRHQQAASRYRQALAVFREAGDRPGQARALTNLGLADLQQRRFDAAIGRLGQALAVFREVGDRPGEARALTNLGLADLDQRRFDAAIGKLRQALDLFQGIGDPASSAHVLGHLGTAALKQGCHQQAAGYFGRALALAQETGDRPAEAHSLNSLGEVFLATGQPAFARAQHTASLGLASELGDRYEQARAHDGLARAHQGTNEPEQARQHWQEALTLYTSLGSPEADKVRTQLLAPAPPQP